MPNKLVIAFAALMLGFATAAAAADDPIAARQALMKKNGGAAKTAFDMAEGKTPFDAGAAAGAMKTLQDDMATFVTLFPEGSDQGDTAASPKIWEDMAGFKAAADKLAADAKTAEAAAAQGQQAFAAALGPIGADCGGCHKVYRIKKN
jgi:cytochrome c556